MYKASQLCLGRDMASPASLLFPPFRLDLNAEQLWCATRAIALRPKTFAVLRYLAEHPGQLATKDELLDAVWGETAVSDTGLKTCVRELREALGDDPRAPQFIETVHRRGYRFRATVQTAHSDLRNVPIAFSSSLPRTVVGRSAELAQLRAWLDKAVQGE